MKLQLKASILNMPNLVLSSLSEQFFHQSAGLKSNGIIKRKKSNLKYITLK